MMTLRDIKDRFGYTTDPAFFQKKLEEHRLFTATVIGLFAVMGPLLWLWDYAVDPVGAQDTLALRGVFVLLVIPAYAFSRLRSIVWFGALLGGTVLGYEVLFIEIVKRLQHGMDYAPGGFMYFALVSVILCQGFSIRYHFCFCVLVALLPHLWALAGWIPGFRHDLYAVHLWPSTVIVILAGWVFAWSYRRRYLTERALEHASNTDPLTGAANRRYFEKLLLSEMLRCERAHLSCALLLLDIDHFKKVNDTYGHPAGDLVIRRLADICRAQSREVDVVARIGGEEFALLLPDTDAEGARLAAERVRECVQAAQMQVAEGKVLNWTVSVGVAHGVPPALGRDCLAGERLIAKADKALYEAKASGRNRVVVAADGPAGVPGPVVHA